MNALLPHQHLLDTELVDIDQLQPGVYVRLDLPWTDHPFTFSSFRIKSYDQIKVLKSLKLGKVRIDPSKSSTLPLSPRPLHAPEPAVAVEVPAPADTALMEAKRERVAALQRQREAVNRVEKQFMAAAGTVKNISNNLFAQPQKTIREASGLVQQMVEAMMSDLDVAIHVMHDKIGSEEVYYHSLNTSVLCLMIGKEMGMNAQDVHLLGLGALFHDIGTIDIPSTILRKKQPLSKAEQSFYQQHCEYGAKIGREVGLPAAVIEIIQNHHELLDGSGYPRGDTGGHSSLHARIVEVVNRYDELCNHNDIKQSLTPYEALSQMFAKGRSKHDSAVLNTFIRCMGVYPPGTVAQLSNDLLCIVTAVNAAMPLKPVVLVYDPTVAKTEAIMLDLSREADLSIVRAIRPGELAPDVLAYLSPRNRLVYYFDAGAKGEPRPATPP